MDSKSSKKSSKSKKKRDKLSENLKISQRTLNFNPQDAYDKDPEAHASTLIQSA